MAGRFTCDQDQQVYGSDPVPSAAAQTSVVNYVQQQFIDTHPGAKPLIIVPTEYSGDQTTAYRTRFDDVLTPRAQIYWTGPAVVSPTIKVSDVTATQRAFPKHQLVVWDNYPVNDYTESRLLLGPVIGREAGVEQHALGITFNELQEQEPSLIVLFTEADYAWNPEAYNADVSWDGGLRELGGSVYPALRTFAENNHSSVLDPRESLTLTPLLSTFRTAYAQFGDVDTAAGPLSTEFARLQAAPGTLRAGWGNNLFLGEAKPWLDKLGLYGTAGQTAVDMLLAQLHGDAARAWQDRAALESTMSKLNAIPQTVAPGVIDPFLAFARGESDGWLGIAWYDGVASVTGTPAAAKGSSLTAAADGNAATAYRAATAPAPGDALTVILATARPVGDVVVLQDPAAPASGMLQGRNSSGQWVTLGPIRAGYADVAASGRTVDALRVVWSAGSPAPTVYEVIPRYADALPAAVTVDRPTVLAAAGTSQQFHITVRGESPGTVSAALAASVPSGWSVQPASQQVSLRSDGRTVSGTYAFTVSVPQDAPQATYPLRFTATSPDGARSASVAASVQVGAVSTQPYRGLVLGDSPAGYWRLGEKSGAAAADTTGHGLAGSYVAPVTLGVPGAISKDTDTAANLAGGYVNVPDAAALQITGPFTLEAWIKPNGVAADPGLGIIERYDAPAKNGYILRLAGGNHLQAWVLGPSGYVLVTGSTVIPAGCWHHVAAVFNGTSLTVYVDGQADGSKAATLAPGAGSGDLRIGARGDDANQRFSGGIDEVAVYNQGLSTNQVATHFLTGASG